MEKTLFVGCDVSSTDFVVCFMNHQGDELGYKTYSNNLPGAREFEALLLKMMGQYSFISLKIATEATSFYDLHLVEFLSSSVSLEKFQTQIFQLNPKIVSNFKRAYIDKDKTDINDSFVIADRLRFGRISEPYENNKPYLPLRRLTRYRFHLVETIAREKTYFFTHLYLKYSNFSLENPFTSVFGTTSLSIITEFSPEELAQMTVEELMDFIVKKGRNHFSEPQKIVKAIKSMGSNSYRLKPGLSSSVDIILTTCLHTIKTLEHSLKDIDKAIEREFKAFPNTLQSIKGIGPVYSAALFSEIGDVNKYDNQAALAKQAGLTWRKFQSGNFNAQETTMTKTGNKYLRYYLVQAANMLRVHNKEYKDFYSKKFKEVNKHQHKRAIVLTARKFVRLLYALLKKGQLYLHNYQQ